MGLKELRMLKNLTQGDCAKYLNISIRTYQTYESDPTKANTSRYNTIYKKLEMYNGGVALNNNCANFNTNVITGNALKAFCNTVSKYEKRDCFGMLKKYIEGDYEGKICILYGLRRTGKTTLIFQMLSELDLDKTAYIKVQAADNMSSLTKDLYRLHDLNFKYVFIDEITLLEDFINAASVLSDIFSMLGMKIVLSGTDSLSFAISNMDELYDRNIMIHTSFISFKEYSRLLNIKSVDKYIEYGGTLKIENMDFDDPDFEVDEVSFRDDESTRKYIDTAISRNIQHALKNDNDGEYFNQLRELYDKSELTNVINRIIENMNHYFLLKVIEDKFKSHDFGSAKNNLLKRPFDSAAYVLEKVDYEKILERLKAIIEVKEKEDLIIKITQEHVEKIKKYLVLLDLIVNCPVRYENGRCADYYVFAQAGMRYCIAKALVYSLMQDEYFKLTSENDRNSVAQTIFNDVKGKMLKDMVLLETKKAMLKNKEVFQFRFDLHGEFDMVIYDKINNTCEIYEIKHSDKALIEQAKHLLNEEKCNIVSNRYGKIVGKYVLYRGENLNINDIKYLNVEEFLCNLK